MNLRSALVACVGALLLSATSVSAATDMSSVNIVEPKLQSKWGYSPGTVRIQAGTWITWSNAGQDTHTVTAVDGTFDSDVIAPSEGFSWFFADPGTVEYTCTLHPWMTGKVIVSSGGPTNPPPIGDDPSLPPTN